MLKDDQGLSPLLRRICNAACAACRHSEPDAFTLVEEEAFLASLAFFAPMSFAAAEPPLLLSPGSDVADGARVLLSCAHEAVSREDCKFSNAFTTLRIVPTLASLSTAPIEPHVRIDAVHALLVLGGGSCDGLRRITSRIFDEPYDMDRSLACMGIANSCASQQIIMVTLSGSASAAVRVAARTLLNAYEAKLRSFHRVIAMAEDDSIISAGPSLGDGCWLDHIGEDGKACELSQLAKQIDDAIEQIGGKAFVKLSTRSPKDSVVLRRRSEAIRASHSQETTDDEIERATLCIGSGRDAMELLCSSQRVFDDLAVVDIAGIEALPTAIAVRKWAELPRWGELTALSSYFKAQLVPPTLVEHKQQVEIAVRGLVSSIAVSIPCHGCAVLDIALGFSDGSVENWLPSNVTVMLVELNPWGKASGAALFSWLDDEEMLHGRAPFEFRLAD